jgi:putative peptide zinc metalloprotease protein
MTQTSAEEMRTTVSSNGQAFVGVSGHPKLSASIELCGKLQDGGFAADQWLIQRDGQFLQLTELLYRIAEASTGENSLAEIAATVSIVTARTINSDQVEQLLVRKLIPAGIIATAADASTPGATSLRQARAASPLAINLKMAVVSPRLIDPCTRVLQVLYWPPVLLTVLVAAFAGHGWLFFVHGVGGSVQDALMEPGRLLATLGLTILGAAFHEFGHATALRYGGGKVRGMGAGLYLVYPAFYTDVTDGYRLGRWARVRTDLGGFYFNLIFGMVLMAAYAVSGAEFLLLVVVVMSLDILRQSMPFVRMDGYWVLADLTGIPDLFTHLPAFVKSVLSSVMPVSGRTERRRLRLKPWVAATFLLYISITVPVLVYVLFLMIKTLPTVLVTAADSFEMFGEQFAGATGQGNLPGAALATTQLLILTMTMAGLMLMLALLGHKGVGVLFSWGRQGIAQGVVSALAAAGLVALVSYLWMPQVPGASSALSSAISSAARPAGPAELPGGETLTDGSLPSSGAPAGHPVKGKPDSTTQFVVVSLSMLAFGLVLGALIWQLAQDRHAWDWRGQLWRNAGALAGTGLVLFVAFLPMQGVPSNDAALDGVGGRTADVVQPQAPRIDASQPPHQGFLNRAERPDPVAAKRERRPA